MKYLKKFNEATIPNALLKQKIDHTLLADFFAEFIDNDAYVESSKDYFEIFITIPNTRQYKKDKKISDYINECEKPLDILKDVEVAIKRVYDKFGIYPKIEEEDESIFWYIHLGYGDLNRKVDDGEGNWDDDYDDDYDDL